MPGDSSLRDDAAEGGNANAGRRVTDLLGSMRFGLAVGLLVVVACILGTILPQESDVAAYLHAHPGRTGWIKFLSVTGLSHVFTAWWFIVLLFLLCLSVAFCTAKRLRTARGMAPGPRRWNTLGSVLTHASLLLILVGGVARGTWGLKGDLAIREGETRASFLSGQTEIALPFSVRLVDFELETYGGKPGDPGHSIIEELRVVVGEDSAPIVIPVEEGVPHDIAPGCTVKVLRKVTDFVIGKDGIPTNRSDEFANPAIQVEVVGPDAGTTNTQWLFARYPDFNMHAGAEAMPFQIYYDVKMEKPGVKDYKSTVEVIEDGKVALTRTLEVNSPLVWRGYSFFQSSYNPEDLAWTSLQVVKDPGVPFVYSGFTALIIGLVIVFYLYPRERAGGEDAATGRTEA